MGKLKIFFAICGIVAIVYCNRMIALSVWQSPDPKRRYNEVCFLTSHNSYAAKEHGYHYAQQQWTIKEQLGRGVRGLMLDTHKHSKSDMLLLCHRNEKIDLLLRRQKPSLLLKDELITIKEFLETHPHDIITIFLENYVRDGKLLDECFSRSGIGSLILTPMDWDLLKNDRWPTLEWMQKQNKRLVIFNSIEATGFTFNQWEHVIENQWGALPFKHAAKERAESLRYRNAKRHLYVVNYFPRVKINFGGCYEKVNSHELDACLKGALKKMQATYNHIKMPNFISLDFVNEGDGMAIVNDINMHCKEF